MNKRIKRLFSIFLFSIFFLTSCGKDKLTLNKLQNINGDYCFYGLEWGLAPEKVQEKLGIKYSEGPFETGGLIDYHVQEAYTYQGVTSYLSLGFREDGLESITLHFRPSEDKQEVFWGELVAEMAALYGEVECRTYESQSDELNVNTYSETYLWENKGENRTFLTLTRFYVNDLFQYVSLDVYMMPEGISDLKDTMTE